MLCIYLPKNKNKNIFNLITFLNNINKILKISILLIFFKTLDSTILIFGDCLKSLKNFFVLDPCLFLQLAARSSHFLLSTLSSLPLCGSSGVSWNVSLSSSSVVSVTLFVNVYMCVYRRRRRRRLGVIYNLVLRHSATRWSRPLHDCHDVTLFA